MAVEPDSSLPLFHDIVLSIIPSDELPLSKAEKLIAIVTDNGGQYIPLRDIDHEIEDLSLLTHIISTHIDFPQYSASLENGVHVVNPSWIIRSADKGRQAQVRQYSPDPSQYFRDVVVCGADLPQGDKDAILAGVIALGGQYSSGISKIVTHLVTNSLNHDKCTTAEQRKLACKIVLPHWFDACFKLGRLINEGPYMFPDPELLHIEAKSRVRDRPSAFLEGAIVASPSGTPRLSPPPSPTHARQNLNAFFGRKVFLADDLQINENLVETLRGLIHYGGGSCTDNAQACSIYIGQYRDGPDYIAASRDGKTVANLSWLYHVINRNKYTDPLGRLLHYPVPRNGINGFQNMRISISNYTGEARIYLENLIRHCGAEFTKTMKQDNTHLITAHTESEKCEAAREWNINIVNHIWLEESYAKCAVQTLTNPRYCYFPARTNLGEVTGQTRFDRKRLEQMYYSKQKETPQKSAATPVSIVKPQKNASSKLALMDENDLNQDSSVPTAEDDVFDVEQPQTTKRPRGRPPKAASTPRLLAEEKENESPVAYSSGRAAKMKAANRLHNQANDIALFQKEMKRKGGVTHGGRRSSLANVDDMSSPAPTQANQRKKRKSDEATYDVTAEGSDLSDGETQNTPAPRGKRAKNAPAAVSLPPIRMRMLVSGSDRWLDDKNKESRDRLKLRQVGILLTEETYDVDIVVAPRLLRTRKFVCALAAGPHVTGMEFLDNALKKGIVDEDPPLLKDPKTEEFRGLNLADSLARAKINKHKLFDGWSIFVTKDVNGGFDTFKEITSVNGGNCLLYAGRTGLNLPKRRISPETDEDMDSDAVAKGPEEYDYVYLVADDTEQDVKLRKSFRRLAEKQGLRARIVTTDWILHAAMSQEIVWKDIWEWKDEGPNA